MLVDPANVDVDVNSLCNCMCVETWVQKTYISVTKIPWTSMFITERMQHVSFNLNEQTEVLVDMRSWISEALL